MDELTWIDYLKKRVKRGKGVITGIGDDCAVVLPGKGKLLLKSDLFIEGVHFKIGDTSFKDIGARAVSRVLSDFAAMAGEPGFIGVSLGKPSYIKEEELKEILSGILFLSKKYKFSLIGGDTAKTDKLFLDVWGVGVVERPVLRSTAKTGDYIFITGKLGQRRFNKAFEPRIKEAVYLAKNFKVNAMIDISDGFIVDLYRILKESGLGALLYKKDIPVTSGEADFYRGEDYELIFTVDKNEPRLKTLRRKFYCVGRIKEESFGYKMDTAGKLSDVKIKGYLHF